MKDTLANEMHFEWVQLQAILTKENRFYTEIYKTHVPSATASSSTSTTAASSTATSASRKLFRKTVEIVFDEQQNLYL